MIFKLGFAKVHHSSGSDEQTRENVTITCTENNSKSPCIFYFPPCKGSPVSNVPGQGQASAGLVERKSSSPMAAVFSFAKPCGYGHGTVRQVKNKKYRLPEPDVFNR